MSETNTPPVIDLDAARIAPFIMQGIEGFLGDPPDSDFQRGYLAELLNVYREGLRRGEADTPIAAAKELTHAVTTSIAYDWLSRLPKGPWRALQDRNAPWWYVIAADDETLIAHQCDEAVARVIALIPDLFVKDDVRKGIP